MLFGISLRSLHLHSCCKYRAGMGVTTLLRCTWKSSSLNLMFFSGWLCPSSNLVLLQTIKLYWVWRKHAQDKLNSQTSWRICKNEILYPYFQKIYILAWSLLFNTSFTFFIHLFWNAGNDNSTKALVPAFFFGEVLSHSAASGGLTLDGDQKRGLMCVLSSDSRKMSKYKRRKTKVFWAGFAFPSEIFGTLHQKMSDVIYF